jgi:hypothetical protein
LRVALVGYDALTSSQTILSGTTTSTTVGASSSRIDELRAKRDRIRVEKERLLKLQELDEMEEAVQREMLEEQKREALPERQICLMLIE